MAPIAPTKRRSLRAKLAAKANGPEPYAPRKAPRPDSAPVSDSFISSKKDKRLVKHSSFVTRIQKANKKPLKRRRPGKKLVTDLDSLKKALPDLLEDGATEEGLKQLKEGKVRLKSLRSRKGAMKRKEKLVKSELERFQGNMAQLNAMRTGGQDDVAVEKQATNRNTSSTQEPSQQSQETSSSSSNMPNRWAALRGFISSTMEQNPAFLEQEAGKK
ncbi:ribosome biogenesis protein SLX9-domain-containing protein [Apiospora saccharicola]|uniref:Ribosome biogenesis protein SLX9 n=1 Tax=Apiospora saccharicola TaxID=335842 RepID=A0ABR1WF79_9PEZI